jgi:opacity protein-like surface antigen
MRSSLRPAVLAAALLLVPSVARADITAFIGATVTPATRPMKGFAVGAGLLAVGFEFEYAHTNEDLGDPVEPGPELRTFMFNGLVQTPFAIAGIQPYGTLGGGFYRETLSVGDRSETSFGTNLGGGAKINLLGPLRLRLDYRLFKLRGSPLHATVQRFYAGINLKF